MNPQAPSWLADVQKVDVEKLSDGAKICLCNARDFLNEVETLANNGCLRHAVGLLELAQEEMGKAQHIVDVFEDATIGGIEETSLVAGTFKNHSIKLAFTPKPHLSTYSKKQRDLRSKFYSSGPSIRHRSFYVDLQRGEWLWGNPDFEEKETILFLVRELRIDCEYIEGGLRNVLDAREMIRRLGLHDERTQDFLKKKFGMNTSERRDALR